MSRDGEAIAARARAMLGLPFRAQGRGEGGVDCIGLVVRAAELSPVRRDYRLRGDRRRELEAGLTGAGLAPVAEWRAGDVLVMKSGAEQLHLGIWTGQGLVHADAGLRRVVERPGAPPWPVLGAWRVEK